MSNLKLFLLGPPRIECDGVPLELYYRKNVALIAYLVTTGERHTREALITLLWPELEPERARANLRRDLSTLRKALGEEWLIADRETVELEQGDGFWLDVDRFHDLLATWQEHGHPQTDVCPRCLDDLAKAVKLYRGDFLAGFSLRDSVSFDDWQSFETEGLRLELASALERLVCGHSAQGAYESAIPYARRWLALDPLHEPAHCHLMQLYAETGQRAVALHQYQECVRVLEAELGIPPSKETTSLYEHIRVQPDRRATLLLPHPAPKHNLPAPTTPFVGRKHELAEIEVRLSDPDCRLLTLVGFGGSGKTRLALEAAMARLEAYEHGVYFVSLASLRSVDGIVPTVAQALGFSFYTGGEPQQQLLDYLRQKNMLIIMDNFEHLLSPPFIPPSGGDRGGEPSTEGENGGTDLVTNILRTAPDVKILATSRARLNVGGEHRFHVGGMDFPESPSGAAADASQYSAIELFLQVARRAQPSFDLTDENLSAVVQVCRLVDGMPLGIRLAAAWVEMLTPAEIAAEIGRSFDLLETDRCDVPARQRSMRATLDHSWRLLTEREREVFRALSGFRGGFMQEAAQEVTHASLHTLRTLANKSLLHRTVTGRYEMHGLLRQYAQEKLDQEPAACEATHNLHCAYYTAAFQQWGADLKGPRQKTALVEMDAEIENARAAWNWAAEQRQVERLDQAMEGLCWFYVWRARYLEGEVACRTAASKSATISSGEGHVLDQAMSAERAIVELRVWVKVLAWQSYFTSQVGNLELADQLMQQSLDLLERPALADQDIRAEKAFALLLIGMGGGTLRTDVIRLIEQSAALYHSLGDRWSTALALNIRGELAHGLGDYGEAQRLNEESLALRRSIGDQVGIADSLLNLGTTARALGQLEEAERLFRESLAIHQEMDARVSVAYAFYALGLTLAHLGKFAESYSLIEKSMAINNDLGLRYAWGGMHCFLAEAKAHLGQYEQARALGQTGFTFIQEVGSPWSTGFSYFEQGLLALAEEAYAEANQLLQKSFAAFQEDGHRECMSWAHALLGYATRGLGQPSQTRQHLSAALQTVADIGCVMPSLMFTLPATALLLADQDKVEQAVEVYALTSCNPFVANSRWFEDVAGRHIAAVASTLPPEVVAAAQERGRARDLKATVQELLDELGE